MHIIYSCAFGIKCNLYLEKYWKSFSFPYSMKWHLFITPICLVSLLNWMFLECESHNSHHSPHIRGALTTVGVQWNVADGLAELRGISYNYGPLRSIETMYNCIKEIDITYDCLGSFLLCHPQYSIHCTLRHFWHLWGKNNV